MTAAVDWAFEQEVDGTAARLTLLYLAREAGDGWECTNAQEEIAAMTGMGGRTVRRAMDALETAKLIKRERRCDERGNRISDRCVLNPGSLPAKLASGQNGQWSDRPVANLAATSDQQEPPTGQNDHRPDWPGYKDSPTESLFPNPSPTGKGGAGGNRTPSSPKSSSAKEHPDFAAWYAEYPAKKSRGQAVKAFPAALAKAGSVQVLIDGVRRYRATDKVRRGFVQNPATWLNAEGWLDGPDLSATGTDGRPEHGPLARVNDKWANGQEFKL